MLSLKKNKQGFTIIEVLIVLAIAGVIMLVVFLAVPALQRNSRNTQRRNDVARIGGAVTEWTQNNNGLTPTTAAHATAIVNNAGTLAQYSTTSVSLATGTQAVVTDTSLMKIVTSAKCDTTDIGKTSGTSNTRQIAIQFATEGGSGPLSVCQEI